MIDWLIDWFIDKLICRLIDWFTTAPCGDLSICCCCLCCSIRWAEQFSSFRRDSSKLAECVRRGVSVSPPSLVRISNSRLFSGKYTDRLGINDSSGKTYLGFLSLNCFIYRVLSFRIKSFFPGFMFFFFGSKVMVLNPKFLIL